MVVSSNEEVVICNYILILTLLIRNDNGMNKLYLFITSHVANLFRHNSVHSRVEDWLIEFICCAFALYFNLNFFLCFGV